MKIAVIGAGASGMFAAVQAAENGAQVCIYEHMDEAGKKLLMTGNGKCNLTNLKIASEDYYSDSDARNLRWQILSAFMPENTVSWFEKHGLMVRNRNDYIYPYCEQAAVVREVLLRACKQAGVKIVYGYDCYRSLEVNADGRFCIGEEYYDRLILACGGKSARHTGSDGSGYELAKRFGHTVVAPKSALVQLHTNLPEFKRMAGVRAQGSITLGSSTQSGEIQFTEYGISGIAVFQLSRHAVRSLAEEKTQQIEVSLDLCPDITREKLQEIITDQISQCEKNSLFEALTGTVHTKILEYILFRLRLEKCMLQEIAGAPEKRKETVNQLVNILKDMRIPIVGSHKLDVAQVTQGGIRMDEVTGSLESVHQKGLFFAGEMLDVDGICGGYNLQWAWASGYAAAQGCLCTEE